LILAIDPGNERSGWALCLHSSGIEKQGRQQIFRIEDCGIDENFKVGDRIRRSSVACKIVIEGMDHTGMPVGKEVFETLMWIGRFDNEAGQMHRSVDIIQRREVRLNMCGSSWAKDANIKQAVIDRLGPVGTVKAPGPMHIVRRNGGKHIWQALGLAITYLETLKSGNGKSASQIRNLDTA